MFEINLPYHREGNYKVSHHCECVNDVLSVRHGKTLCYRDGTCDALVQYVFECEYADAQSMNIQHVFLFSIINFRIPDRNSFHKHYIKTVFPQYE